MSTLLGRQIQSDGPTMFLARASAILLALICSLCVFSFSQQRPERTIDEIKAEAIHRAEVGQYPLIGLDPSDVKEAFNSIHTRDKDEWAAAFMAVGDRYMNEAKAIEKADPAEGERRLHPRLATLFIRALANPRIARQTTIV